MCGQNMWSIAGLGLIKKMVETGLIHLPQALNNKREPLRWPDAIKILRHERVKKKSSSNLNCMEMEGNDLDNTWLRVRKEEEMNLLEDLNMPYREAGLLFGDRELEHSRGGDFGRQ